MTQNNFIQQMDALEENFIKQHPEYITIKIDKAADFMFDMLFNKAKSAKERDYCLKKIFNIIDNPDIRYFIKINLVPKFANLLADNSKVHIYRENESKKYRYWHGDSSFDDHEAEFIIQKIAEYAVKKEKHTHLQPVAIKALGEILNNSKTVVPFNKYIEYIHTVSPNLASANNEVASCTVELMSNVITDEENGLSEKTRLRYMSQMLTGVLHSEIQDKTSKYPYIRFVNGLGNALDKMSANQDLFLKALNNTLNTLHIRLEAEELVSSFSENIMFFAKNISHQKQNFRTNMQYLSYDTKNGFAFEPKAKKIDRLEKPKQVKADNHVNLLPPLVSYNKPNWP